MMRRFLLATAAVAIATPAVARDGSGYVGLEGGVLFPQHQSGVFTSTFTQSVQTPAAGTPAAAPGTGVVGALPAPFNLAPATVTGGADVRFKEFYNSDSAWAYQGIAGLRYALGPNVDIGLKYRYFRTGKLNLTPAATTFVSTRQVAVPNVPAAPGGPASGTTNVAFTRTSNVVGAFDDHFSSHSLLLSLA